MKRGSSTRLMGAPRTPVAMTSPARSLRAPPGRGGGTGLHRLRRLAGRGHDVLVARAAAVVAVEGVADLGVGGIGVPGEQVGGDHDHPRGTEAALESVLLPEGLLERVEAFVGRQALD